MDNANKNTKPCQFCGTPVPVGNIVGCSPCQKESWIKFFASNPNIRNAKRI